MTQMSIVRPKDPHIWMGRYVLSKATNVACIVYKDGTALEVREEKGEECSGSAVSVARALRAQANKTKVNSSVDDGYFELLDRRVSV